MPKNLVEGGTFGLAGTMYGQLAMTLGTTAPAARRRLDDHLAERRRRRRRSGGMNPALGQLIAVLRAQADSLQQALEQPTSRRATRGPRRTRSAGHRHHARPVSASRAQVGARVNRLETQQTRLKDLELNVEDLLSKPKAPTWQKAMVDFSMQQSIYQSAMQSGAGVLQPSLLDFLR